MLLLNLIVTNITAATSEFTDNTTFYLHKMLCLVHLLGMAITFLWSGIKWLQN